MKTLSMTGKEVTLWLLVEGLCPQLVNPSLRLSGVCAHVLVTLASVASCDPINDHSLSVGLGASVCFRGPYGWFLQGSTVLGGLEDTRETQGLGPEHLALAGFYLSGSALLCGLLLPADSTALLRSPEGIRLAQIPISFLCLTHSQATELSVAWLLGSRYLDGGGALPPMPTSAREVSRQFLQKLLPC